MAEDYGAFVDSPIASDISLARLHRRWGVDGVVADGPDAMDSLEVTANSTSQVSVGSGYAVVGGWFYRTDTSVNVNVPSNGSGSSRRDLLVVRADPEEDEAYLHIREGTPGSGEFPPPVLDPAGPWDLPLARITVAGGSSVIAPGDVEDTRRWTAPTGAVPCTSSRRPLSPHEGMIIDETDTGRVAVYRSGSWRTVAETSYPTSWQAINLGTGWRNYGTAGRHPSWRFLAPGRVELRGTAESTRSAGATDPDIIGRLPVSARPGAFSYQTISVGRKNGFVTARLSVASTGTTVYLPGQLVLFGNTSSQRPDWVSLDGVMYDLE